MRTFTIDPDNNITALVEVPAGAETAHTFKNQRELARLTADWPMARLMDLWNSFAGVAPFTDLKPVRKFTDRKVAVARIWKAIERLAAETKSVGSVAPVQGKGKKDAEKGSLRDTARAGAEHAASAGREGSKRAEIVDLMRRPSGPHSPRSWN